MISQSRRRKMERHRLTRKHKRKMASQGICHTPGVDSYRNPPEQNGSWFPWLESMMIAKSKFGRNGW